MQQHTRTDHADSTSLGRTEPPSSDQPCPGSAVVTAAARWRRRPDDRLKKAVRRVLIALSFKSNKMRSRSVEPGSKLQLQQQQQQSLQLSSWQLIPGTGLPPTNYWDPVRCHLWLFRTFVGYGAAMYMNALKQKLIKVDGRPSMCPQSTVAHVPHAIRGGGFPRGFPFGERGLDFFGSPTTCFQ